MKHFTCKPSRGSRVLHPPSYGAMGQGISLSSIQRVVEPGRDSHLSWPRQDQEAYDLSSAQ